MQECQAYTFAEMSVGQKVEFFVVLSEELINLFSELSGDYNPLHMDEAYALETQFGARIVHGQLGVSFFSRLVGMHLPGKHALYLNQQTTFRSPMYVGDEIIVRGEIVRKNDAMQTLIILTEILSKDTTKVHINGEALVKMLK